MKLILVTKLQTNPDIFEIVYQKKKLFGGYTHNITTKVHCPGVIWRELSTNKYMHDLDSALNTIQKHLKTGETYTL